MKNSWIFLCGICVWAGYVQGTYRYGLGFRCDCNGKSNYCLPDSLGLHCLDCQGNTEGRHCEACKEGFHHQRAGESCRPCQCNSVGAVSPKCDTRGRCSCKGGAQGDKCNRCPDGTPLTSIGCAQSDGQLVDHTVETLPCFCSGHSIVCSPAKGFSVHTIASTFDNGPEGWRAATGQAMTPAKVQFRWSPTHRDVEVVSKDSMPVYLYAPDSYLGNQGLSYGQNLSFSLRLDRGVRHPSTSDVVLEGSGLRVAASLGDLRTIVPCATKISYTFRLDEQTGSKWKPHLSSFQFQNLLQNLTAIKIRATFGEGGRGYLDNVRLVSARQGPGSPAPWVQQCRCPAGFEGQSCERCAAGYRRRSPRDGALGPCDACNCRGGSCDPETGDCYSADETPGGQTCPPGSYNDPDQPRSCLRCPCALGVSCSVTPGSQEVRCDLCPPGTTGSRCQSCEEGFYGDPLGEQSSVRRPCRRCHCNGHLDQNSVGNCDPYTGECLKCQDHTRGFYCEACLDGYHHSQAQEPCKPCECSPEGSRSNRCSDGGQCSCREGFEGLRCQRSDCPSCFNLVKNKMEGYAGRLREIESLFTRMETGTLPVNDAQMERAVREAEELVSDLQRNTHTLSDSEKSLQRRLADISRSQLTEDRDIQAISETVQQITQQDRRYQRQISDVQRLIDDVRRKLEEAKFNIKQAEFPLGDAPMGTDVLSTLVHTATGLAEKHQSQAEKVESTADSALAGSQKALALMTSALNRENKVKELIGDLKTKYDANSAQVKAMENQASRLSGAARDESRMAGNTLDQITSLERNLPGPHKAEIDAVVAKLGRLGEWFGKNLTEYRALQEGIQGDKTAAQDLLARGKANQQGYDRLLARVNAAKADTEEALRGITGNMDGVDGALNSLRGFDGQIGENKALADAAIKRLPGISATIQQAVGSNSETLFIINGVTGDYDDALATVQTLGGVVSRLEGISGSLPAHGGLAKDATRLKEGLQGLKRHATVTEGKIAAEMDNAERQRDRAQEASAGASGAFTKATNTRDAVGETLLLINDLLSLTGQPGSVDEDQLSKLEGSISNTRRQVNQQLRPRLRDLEEMEALQRTKLYGINADIDTILEDISNLEDIRRTIPKGCYNSPPIERP